ncbi:LPD28 domain-containing protein [Cetobacterium sp.]|uniref:LPD28 domain-containing protein n=1 Tax=Cetobacterium sp. TaxID=2071632 RepID=UPI003F376BF8
MRIKGGLGFIKSKKNGIGIPVLLKKDTKKNLLKELNLNKTTDITNIMNFEYDNKNEDFPILKSKTKPWIYIYPWQLKAINIDFQKKIEIKCIFFISKLKSKIVIYIKGDGIMEKKDVFLKLIDNEDYSFIEVDVKDNKSYLYGFRDTRLSKEELALAKENGFYIYELRTSDEDDSMPYSIEKNVLVNFYGTIITPKKIEEVENGKHIIIEDYGLLDYSFIDEKIDEALEG